MKTTVMIKKLLVIAALSVIVFLFVKGFIYPDKIDQTSISSIQQGPYIDIVVRDYKLSCPKDDTAAIQAAIDVLNDQYITQALDCITQVHRPCDPKRHVRRFCRQGRNPEAT
ncbi:hypothetical protein ACFL5Z_19090 [Planctomycetota bacterium]